MVTHRSWDQTAAGYDDEAGHGIRHDRETALWRSLFGRLFPARPRLRILDVGTGTGFVALFLAESGHEVTGMDYSSGMLDVARDKAAARSLDVRFVLGDIASPDLAGLPDLSVPESGFDAVVSRHVLWALPEPARTIGDWAAVTRPGGRIVAIDGIWVAHRPALRIAELAGYCVEAVRTRRRPFRATANPDLPLTAIRDPEPASQAFTSAGLSNVAVETLPDIDRADRAGMSRTERLRHHWRRYLVTGTVPAVT